MSEELDSCLSWLGCGDEAFPMPPRLVETVLDQVMAASGEAAAVTRRMMLLHQAGVELAKAAFREGSATGMDATRMIPTQRPQPREPGGDGRTFPPTAPSLTPREREILQLLGTGRSNRQISRRLGVAERTVKNHLSSLFSKLDATDRTTAVLAALRYGMISLTPDTAHRSP